MDKIVPGEPLEIGTGLVEAMSQKLVVGRQSPPVTHRFAKLLDAKRYEYKFRVDGNWRFAPDQQVTRDQSGNENNVVDLTNAKNLKMLLQEQEMYNPNPNSVQQYQQQQFLLQQL